MTFLAALFAALAAAPDLPAPYAPPAFEGAGPTHVDLLRVVEGGPRIYVRATLPDGSLGLFMVDTGADISVLLPATAARLGLTLDEDGGTIIGLGGISQTDRTVLPTLAFGANGETVVHGIEMAVGVPGMAETAGAMPLDGLLGNNVWSRFVLELDYPADRMVLHPPDSVHFKRRRTTELYFDGSHVFAAIELRTRADPNTVHQVTLPIDTGAGELSFCGRGLRITDSWSAGLEPVMGLGSSSSLPFYRNLRMTRRIDLAEVRLAGQQVAIDSARWIDFDGPVGCGNDLPGLAGHELLAGHRVIFDYGNGALELSASRRKRRQVNGHRVLLGEVPTGAAHALYRAKLHLFLDEPDAAIVELTRALAHADDADEARVLLAALLRDRGDLEGAWDLLQSLPPEALVEQQEIGAMVNGLMFRDAHEQALQLAQAAVDARPDAAEAWVALADARTWEQDWPGAHAALQRAVALEKHPDAHLLRRARVAVLAGDRHASLAHVRKFLQLYPMGGEAIWFYTNLLDAEEATAATFRADLERAMERLHPASRPLDFLVAAYHAMGDEAGALAYLDEGIARDCDPAGGVAKDNCLAWYWSLAGVRPDPSLTRIQRALADGDRSDYLDTLAMVRLSRGELVEAHEAALAAARRAPDNVYMLWQLDRLEKLLREES